MKRKDSSFSSLRFTFYVSGFKMAIDTRMKRFSMMNMAMPHVYPILFEADGAVDADDRAFLLHLYGGIALSVTFQITLAFDLTINQNEALDLNINQKESIDLEI